MRISDLSKDNENYFFHCLWPERPENRKSAKKRKQWYRNFKSKGYVAKVLELDNGTVVGKCHYIPIEHSPLIGKDILVILCLYIHRYAHYVGDQRGKGYGRYLIREIERDARSKGYKGVAAWAMDMDWNPVSFYKHMGYMESDRNDRIVVVWKPFHHDVIPPRLLPVHSPQRLDEKKINVFVADNKWCDGEEKMRVARKAVKGLRGKVNFLEARCHCNHRHLHLGNAGGIFLDEKPYKPYSEAGSVEELRSEILRLYEEKNTKG